MAGKEPLSLRNGVEAKGEGSGRNLVENKIVYISIRYMNEDN